MERLILADESLAEIGFLDFDIDLELGDSNDFVIYIPYPEWDGKLQPGMYVYVPGTEYGGVIRAVSAHCGLTPTWSTDHQIKDIIL